MGAESNALWPNSNRTQNEEELEETGLEANVVKQPDAATVASDDTTQVLRKMSYVGGMEYARTRLMEATAYTTSGKGKRTRPPTVLAQTAATGPHGTSRASSPQSKSSARSSAYRAVHEAAVARKALLDAQMEARQAVIRLTEDTEGCNREHEAITADIEALQKELKASAERNMRGQDAQMAHMSAMNYRMTEMTDMMAARELRMEAQIQEMCSQVQLVNNALQKVKPMTPTATKSPFKSLFEDTEASIMKAKRSLALKSRGSEANPAPSSSKPLTPDIRFADESDELKTKPAVVSTTSCIKNAKGTKTNPITIDSSGFGLSSLEQKSDPFDPCNVTGTHTTFLSAKTTQNEITTDFRTAIEDLPRGNPCASSTKRKETSETAALNTTNDSIRSTKGSSLLPSATREEEEAISPEQLRFTEAISKAMSKELAPLISGRDQTRARPTVYKGTKDGTVDGWLLVMKRFLERVHSKSTMIDKAWAIIDHLEGEARNYIINKSEPERDEPDKVFTLLASRFGTGGNRMQVRQTFMSRTQQENEDWMQ